MERQKASGHIDRRSFLDGAGRFAVGGLTGGDYTAGLFRLFGDVNGDRAVNGLDFAAFRAAFGSGVGDVNYLVFLDANGDGALNGLDFASFRARFGTILP